jgi:hypothetical protein
VRWPPRLASNAGATSPPGAWLMMRVSLPSPRGLEWPWWPRLAVTSRSAPTRSDRGPAGRWRGLKQYLEGADASTTADKEHAAASLGDAEVARVKHPPGNAVPELNQRSQDRREVPPLVGREEAGDVLQQNPARTYGANDAGEVEEQPRAGSGEAGAAAGD